MRKLAFTAAIAAATLVSAPAADAHPVYHYTGGCSMTVVSADMSNTPTWTIEVHIAAVATDGVTGVPAPVPIEVGCWLRVDGVDHGYKAVAESIAFATTGPHITTIVAPFGATFILCDDVLVAGEFHRDCRDVPLTHADSVVCGFLPGQNDVQVGEKIVYDCPAYNG